MHRHARRRVVPAARLELARLAAADFESATSTDFVTRAAMAAQCINLLMEGAQQSLNTNNTGALVACIAQLDRLVGLSVPAVPPKRP